MPKSAFTLLELLIVITIVAILAAAMVPFFKTTRLEAQIVKARQELEALAFAGRQCYYDTGVLLGPDLLDTPGPYLPGWKGPYIAEVHNDSWGEPYMTYSVTLGTAVTMHYCSFGPNKITDGGGGDDIDVVVVTNPHYYP